MPKVKTKKSEKINPIISFLICSVLLFTVYNSISIIVLGFFGETALGVLTSYSNRLDNQKGDVNRSRTVSKGYRFTVSGREYKGYVIYRSDEAWPDLRDGEVRRERISYLAVLPYINKPKHLVGFDEIGLWGLLYHVLSIPGCAFLFLLITGRFATQKKQKKQTNNTKKSDTRKDGTMICENCGTKLSENAAFCSICGVPAHNNTSPGVCASCGARLREGDAFCTDCGAPVGEVAKKVAHTSKQDAATPPQSDTSAQNHTALVGWSSRSTDPEILEAAQKNKKSAIGCAWFFMLLFPIGFLLAGLFIDEMPLNEAIIIGIVLGVLMLIINLMRIKGMKKPVWEGVVTEKFQKKRHEHNKSDDTYTDYTEFTVVIRTDTGKKKRITERDSRRHMYDYLIVGDRVRYHPAFGTYEKYDKSKDRIIYCNVCSMMNPISNDHCQRCNNLLFK